MKTLLEIFNLSTEFLQKKGIQNSRREAQYLISDLLKIRPLDLYLQYDRPLNQEELDLCRQAIQRRGKGEPSQYIIGEVEFLDCFLDIGPDVLIPRQETEILADMIVKQIENEESHGKILWDMCCGSGCLGIAIKKKLPQLEVSLSDISEAALQVAKQNAKQNEVEVRIIQGDLFKPFADEKADYIVCNPPYISEEEFAHLDIEVRGFEPKIALVAEEKGLAFYKRIVRELPHYLKSGGKLWLEMGHEQGEAVLDLFKGIKTKRAEIRQDWSGKDRFFFLEIE